MKQVVHTFNQPIAIIQVFRLINEYDKTKKSLDDRKNDLAWLDVQKSLTGFITEGTLNLPDTVKQLGNFSSANLITLEDDIINPAVSQNRSFLLTKNAPFDIFRFVKNDGIIELHLNYSYFGIGTPTRPDTKLCNLKKDEPVELKINGKTDASLSSRRARIFKEQQYIFHYLGDFRNCVLLPENDIVVSKQIPSERKLVDMIKPLW